MRSLVALCAGLFALCCCLVLLGGARALSLRTAAPDVRPTAASTTSPGPMNPPALPAPSADSTRVATSAPGRDLGEQITNAFAACHHDCIVRVPAGTYTYRTTITLPVIAYRPYTLDMDPAANITYTGSGDAIVVRPISIGGARLIIRGGQLLGNPQARAGIHVLPTSEVTIRESFVKGFGNGDGIFIEGPNSVLLENNLVVDNRIGLHLAGAHCSTQRDSAGLLLCGPDVSGAGFAPNAVHVIGNSITNSTQWGVFEGAAPGVTPALGNIYIGNNLESNGKDGRHGSVLLAYSLGTQVVSNYFEGTPPYIQLGVAGGRPATGVAVRGNYFTVNKDVPVSIALVNSVDAMIEDNAQFNPFPNSSPCFLALGNEKGTYVGKNHIESVNAACRDGKPAPLPGR